MFNRNDIKTALQKEIKERKCERLFKGFVESSGIAGFGAWDDIVDVLHDTRVSSDLKDCILSAMFIAMRKSPDPAWLTVMTVVFWPALNSIFIQKRKWDTNPEERWQRLYMAFLDALDRFSPEHRNFCIPTKIFCFTLNALYSEYQHEWAYKNAELNAASEISFQSKNDPESEFVDDSDERLEFMLLMARISKLKDRNSISQTDFQVLTELYADGLTLAEYAEQHGISLESAKKRRKRALESLRNHLGTTF